MSAVYRWSGEYFGFWIGDNLFNSDGENIAYRDGEKVWSVDGVYVGEVTDENYILRHTAMGQPAKRMERARTGNTAPLAHSAKRAGRAARASFDDATYRL